MRVLVVDRTDCPRMFQFDVELPGGERHTFDAHCDSADEADTRARRMADEHGVPYIPSQELGR